MHSRFCFQYGLLAVLVSIGHGMIMVESVDGSFVPWGGLHRRAPGDPVPVRLTNNDDLSYLATVLMGTPPQQVPMAAALSQDLVAVASPVAGVDNTSYYNSRLSSTSSPTNEVATVHSLSGETFSASLVGESCVLQSVTSSFAYNASVAVTDSSVNGALYPPGANGILGYGIGKLPDLPKNASLVNTFLPTDFTNAVCGVELNHKDDPVSDGVLTMGAVDSTAFIGGFANALVPSDSPASWSVPYDKLSYGANGTTYDAPGLLASIDIIHPGIKVPTPVAEKIYSCIPHSQRISETVWSIPCNSTFPITLTFSGTPFTINERDTIKKHSNGTCHGVITGGAHKIGEVGAPFLRNVYTHFGVNKTSDGPVVFVGFATKKVRQK